MPIPHTRIPPYSSPPGRALPLVEHIHREGKVGSKRDGLELDRQGDQIKSRAMEMGYASAATRECQSQPRP